MLAEITDAQELNLDRYLKDDQSQIGIYYPTHYVLLSKYFPKKVLTLLSWLDLYHPMHRCANMLHQHFY